jgi:drug/metabolite transporter (DMT)-like permease
MNLVKCSGAAVLFLAALALLPRGTFGRPEPAALVPLDACAWLALSGVIGIGLGDTLYFLALERLGVRRSMMLGLLAPIFAALAAAAAGQPLPGARGAAGIAVTLAGLLFFLRVAPLGAGAALGQAPLPRRRRARSAILFGAGAALCQALGIVLTKGAIDRVGVLPASVLRLAAGAISIVIVETLRGRSRALLAEAARGFTRRRLLAAAFAGTVLGFYLYQLAILLGSPPVVATLTATSPVLAAPLAARWLGERLPRSALLATLVAVAGAALVVLD